MSSRRQQQHQQFPPQSMFRKITSAASVAIRKFRNKFVDDAKIGFKHHDHNKSSSTTRRLFIILCFIFLPLYFLFSIFHTIIPTTTTTIPKCPDTILPFYIYKLPPQFNTALLSHCKSLNIYTNMCPYITNNGLGLPLLNSTSWFTTHQFLAEMIFHARANSHPCRVHNPSLARLFYIPFYAGLYASSSIRITNLTLRDSMAHSLSSYLISQPNWSQFHGHDHFLAIGRTAWDFMRPDDKSNIPDYGANSLLNLPIIRNTTILTVERHPWNHHSSQFGIPYPSYFHPHQASEIQSWQDVILTRNNRKFLFSFVGGTRPGLEKAKVRDMIINQCRMSTSDCNLLDCSGGNVGRCFHPSELIRVMLDSEFCLQPPGDSFTRRSMFDALLTGCVPVFFSKHTAYTQYEWYLPEKRDEYSVFIDEDGDDVMRIKDVLRNVTKERIRKMRRWIVKRVLPRVTYMHPDYVGGGSVYDAVDVALEELSRRVKKLTVDGSAAGGGGR